MGQIADDMVNGACCELCGCYFEEEQGIPSVCNDCWEELSEEEKAVRNLSDSETL
jgi:hypothetical protein